MEDAIMYLLSVLFQTQDPVISTGALNFIANSGTTAILLGAVAWFTRNMWPVVRDYLTTQAALNKATIETLRVIQSEVREIREDSQATREDMAVVRDKLGLPNRARRVGDKRVE